MTRITATLISILLLTATSATSSQAAVRADLSQSTLGIHIVESTSFGPPPSLFGTQRSGPGAVHLLCGSIHDETCTAASAISGWSHLPPCIAPIGTNCISNFYAIDPEGKRIEGEFTKYATPDGKYDYPASEVNKLPQGKSQGGIWELPGVTHSGGNDKYFVSTIVNLGLNKTAGTKVSKERFYFNSFGSGISPVNEVAGNYNQAVPSDGFAFGYPGNVGPNSCVMTGGGICFLPQEFPKEYRFGLQVVLASEVKGWFHGRIFQPVIDVKADGIKQVLTFEALPVQVPTLYERVNTSEIGNDFRAFLSGDRSFADGGSYFMPGNSGKEALDMVGYWLPLLKDKATTSVESWSVRTLYGEWDSDSSRCLNSSSNLAGIVTTNSLVYSAGPPTYNKAEGSLDYKLLSPHFTANGDVAIGTYDLVISSDVARCIYGFSKAPIQAVISIVGADGENKVATTLVREKDGWLTLSANGFTFSSPTIRVKLSQEASETEILGPVKKTKKQATITCTKGKKVQRVYGVKPKCPTGYKKK
ncbi:hypothetical protein MCEMRE130_01138 [Candidatus Nanopelagicaceae bacterium]